MPAGKGAAYIDLSLAASVVNRRFYRQGLNWAIGNMKVMTFNTEATTFGVLTAQDSWTTTNAWQKSYSLYQEMNSFALKEAKSAKPKYFDYKIFLDSGMYDEWKASVDAGADSGGGFQGGPEGNQDPVGILMPANFYGTNGGTNNSKGIYQKQDWDYSQFVIPKVDGSDDTDSYYAHIHGASTVASKAIISGYAFSRAFPFSPDPDIPNVSTSWLTSVMRQGTDQTEDVLDDLEVQNVDVPYDQDQYPGGNANADGPELVAYDGFTGTNNSGVIQSFNTGPFNAQCGLIKMIRTGNLDYPLILEVNLIPGEHRGYLCQPMQDV